MANVSAPRQLYQQPISTRPAPQAGPQQSSSSNSNVSNASNKPDYVYFDRSTTGFSDEAVPKAKGAQLKLEHFYKVAVESAIERNQR